MGVLRAAILAVWAWLRTVIMRVFKTVRRAVIMLIVTVVGIGVFAYSVLTGGVEVEAYGGGYYHLSQGSELFPYDFFLIVERPDSTELFIDHLSDYGLIPDPEVTEDNPFGLPVGLSVAKHQGSPLKMVGMTCSACHSGQIVYGGQKREIIGAPGMFDPDLFFNDLATAAEQTLKDPEKRFRFLQRYIKQKTGMSNFLTEFDDSDDMEAAGPFEKRVLDELNGLIDDEIQKTEKYLKDGGRDARFVLLTGRTEAVPEEYQSEDYGESVEADQEIQAASKQEPVSPPSQAYKRPSTSLLGKMFEGLATDIRIFIASIEFMRNYSIVKDRATSLPGNGRVDAFGKVRNMVLPLIYGSEVVRPTTAPVSFPHLWETSRVRWLHWNGNTDSVMERNVLEALGSGAIADLTKFDSTVNFDNLYTLETMTHDFKPPVWPEDFLPPINAEQAEEGRKIFEGEGPYEDMSKGNCISCHDMAGATMVRDLQDFKQFPLAEMGTDPNHAENFNHPVDGGNGEFFKVIQGLAGNITNRYYTRYNISEALQLEWEDNRKPIEWRSPIDAPLPGRPLSGVWATAPYLHNGSVPTLYDLLLASEDRPTTFTMGSYRFDPVKVGYETDAPDALFVFDVNAPVVDGSGKEYPEFANGNSNRGHEFGAALSEEERWALVEYMKTL